MTDLPKRNNLHSSGTTALSGSDHAKASGPAVWLDMDQQALDDAYDQSKYAPNRSQVVERIASNSDMARERLGAPRRFAYGPTANEALDLYPAAATNAPISIFVHGGAWQHGLAKNSAFAAELFVRAGAHYVVLDFINVIEAGGDLMPMAAQVRCAIAWVYRNATSFGGDPNRIHLYGHSSGAHLAGVAMVTDWRGSYDLPTNVVKTGLLCSGMYDLWPVRLSARSRYVNFTTIWRRRSAHNVTSAESRRRSCWPMAHWKRRSSNARVWISPPPCVPPASVWNCWLATDHFEIVETLASPYGLLGRAALAQIAAQ